MVQTDRERMEKFWWRNSGLQERAITRLASPSWIHVFDTGLNLTSAIVFAGESRVRVRLNGWKINADVYPLIDVVKPTLPVDDVSSNVYTPRRCDRNCVYIARNVSREHEKTRQLVRYVNHERRVSLVLHGDADGVSSRVLGFD